jgi:hypothetical protein
MLSNAFSVPPTFMLISINNIFFFILFLAFS